MYGIDYIVSSIKGGESIFSDYITAKETYDKRVADCKAFTEKDGAQRLIHLYRRITLHESAFSGASEKEVYNAGSS